MAKPTRSVAESVRSATVSGARPARGGVAFTTQDLRLLRRGLHTGLHHKLGAHLATVDGIPGTTFAVWAPNAASVSVVGDFNGWDPRRHPLGSVPRAGIWTVFVAGVEAGALYKYHIESSVRGHTVAKTDPLAFRCETPPRTASIVWDLAYAWSDAPWLGRRGRDAAGDSPIAIYEVHLGSWRRSEGDRGAQPGYRQLAGALVDHVRRLGFTHVEFLPPKEHPYYGSWGYQTTGYFAPTSRYGTPQDLMFLIDELHRNGIGVIFDWVPSHFPIDEHGLGFFDGTHLYEHADPRLGFHPDWGSFIFNYGRGPVSSFLLSSALYWIETFHVDALRVDAVASMLYLDYSRKDGEWVPNRLGGRENLEAVTFLRRLNDAVHEAHPDVLMIAEESTTWPMVSRPTEVGGLGFDTKWDMGWMHDTLEYFKLDPIHRKYNHDKLTFRMFYAFSENFLLALSHDEVVHGKGSLLTKMHGDEWQRFANLRALLGLMYGQPGKKLLFMGTEIGQWREWSHERGLDWFVLHHPLHAGLQRWVADLNRVYREQRALHQRDFDARGFRWIDCRDADNSVISWTRHARDEDAPDVLVVCNLTPVPRERYRIGAPRGGSWRELLNSDATEYGGSGLGNLGQVEAVAMRYHGQPFSLELTLPPLSALLLQPGPPAGPGLVGTRQ